MSNHMLKVSNNDGIRVAAREGHTEVVDLLLKTVVQLVKDVRWRIKSSYIYKTPSACTTGISSTTHLYKQQGT